MIMWPNHISAKEKAAKFEVYLSFVERMGHGLVAQVGVYRRHSHILQFFRANKKISEHRLVCMWCDTFPFAGCLLTGASVSPPPSSPPTRPPWLWSRSSGSKTSTPWISTPMTASGPGHQITSLQVSQHKFWRRPWAWHYIGVGIY